MCDTCGCSSEQDHEHENGRRPNLVELPVPILSANNASARRIRSRLSHLGIIAFDIVGTPGAGKTALLEATLARLAGRAGVIVADLATDNDARRLRTKGGPVVALETGTSCHLPAPMLERALDRLPLDELDLLFIENVGNLVCPALFDLGEAAKAVVMSVTEGTDKPEKYPVMFQRASAVIVNKLDLLPYVDFDLERATGFARRMNPDVEVFPLSARTGEGLEPWLSWIARRRAALRTSAALSAGA